MQTHIYLKHLSRKRRKKNCQIAMIFTSFPSFFPLSHSFSLLLALIHPIDWFDDIAFRFPCFLLYKLPNACTIFADKFPFLFYSYFGTLTYKNIIFRLNKMCYLSEKCFHNISPTVTTLVFFSLFFCCCCCCCVSFQLSIDFQL